MGRVKENTLRKVEDYFARETNIRGSTDVQVTMEDLRRATRLSLATIYKALEEMVEYGKLQVVDSGSRRSPKIYRYQPQAGHESGAPAPNDVAGLARALEEAIHELAVKEKVIEALRAKLALLESQEAQVLYRLRVAEDTEVIVRKRHA